MDRLNINLSGRSVGDSEFLGFLEAQTLDLMVDTGRVCFEITETAAAGAGAQDFTLRLKKLGSSPGAGRSVKPEAPVSDGEHRCPDAQVA